MTYSIMTLRKEHAPHYEPFKDKDAMLKAFDAEVIACQADDAGERAGVTVITAMENSAVLATWKPGQETIRPGKDGQERQPPAPFRDTSKLDRQDA